MEDWLGENVFSIRLKSCMWINYKPSGTTSFGHMAQTPHNKHQAWRNRGIDLGLFSQSHQKYLVIQEPTEHSHKS